MRNNGYITTGRTSEGENINCRITQPSDDHIGVHIYTGYTDNPVFSVVLGDDTDDDAEGCTIDDLVDVLVGAIHSIQSRRIRILEDGDYVAFGKIEPNSFECVSVWYRVNRYWMYNAICHILQHSEK